MSTRSISRNDSIKRRKSFLPSLIVAISLWLVLGGIIYFVDPYSFGALPLFFFILLLAGLITFSLLFANTRRGLLFVTALIIFLLLRYVGIGNILNFILIAGLAVTIELYFMRK